MATYELLMAEHRILRLAVDRVRLLAGAPPETVPDRRRRAVLEHELQRLLANVVAHFGHEEEGGYMKGIVEQRPTVSNRVDALRRDHAEIRGELETIARVLSTSAPDEVSPRLLAVLDRFERHERDENELVEDTFLTDYGGEGA